MCPSVKDINVSWPIYFLSFDDTGSKFQQWDIMIFPYQQKTGLVQNISGLWL